MTVKNERMYKHEKNLSGCYGSAAVLSLVGCTGTADGNKTGVKAAKVDPADFPEAEFYPEFEWPAFGISEKLPTPDWSNRGKIDYDTVDYFSVYIGYSTKADYDAYVKKCYDAGFSIDYYSADTVIGYLYSAENEEGYSIEVCYRAKNVISIDISAPSSSK